MCVSLSQCQSVSRSPAAGDGGGGGGGGAARLSRPAAAETEPERDSAGK